MNFLNPCRPVVRHTNMHVIFGQHLSNRTTTFSGQRDNGHFPVVSGLDCIHDIGGISGSLNGLQQITGLAKSLNLFREHIPETVIIADRGHN